MLGVIDEEMMGILVAGITKPLHGLLLEKDLGIAEAPETKTVRPEVLREIALGYARWPGFEHEHMHTLLAQHLGDPAAARTGSDYDNVIGIGAFVHHPSSLEDQHPGRLPVAAELFPVLALL